MLLTGSTSIRDIVLFPLLRRIDPNANQGSEPTTPTEQPPEANKPK
jgi:hypothetical protein